MVSGLVLSQIAVAVMGIIGAALGVGILRSVREWKWRQTGYKFAAALTIYSVIELMALTDIFYDPVWIQLIAKGLFIIYMVYGIFNLRRTIGMEE
ncbi:MAG: hypothetical protein ABEJ69_00310 [Candidatus Nanohaloarchaea archaeon]